MFRYAVVAGLSLVLGGPLMVVAENKLTDESKQAVSSVVASNNQFALALYENLHRPKGNLFFSPYSISDALAMTSAGARGKTLEEMEKTLHFSLDQEKLPGAFQQLIDTLQGDAKTRKY